MLFIYAWKSYQRLFIGKETTETVDWILQLDADEMDIYTAYRTALILDRYTLGNNFTTPNIILGQHFSIIRFLDTFGLICCTFYLEVVGRLYSIA